jgi:phosphoserine phosphatase
MDSIHVTETLSTQAAAFIASVLRLQPQVAALDCDGTLWAGDAGGGFFEWELSHGVVPGEVVRWARARYAEYLARQVDETTMCAEMVTIHRGLDEVEVQRAANRYFEENMIAAIFPEMRELVRRLQESGCDVWAVSSTSEWVIRAGMRQFVIPENRILAASVKIENGRITDRIVRVPSGEGKALALRDVVRRDPDVAFGNSRWDLDMLEIARHAFAVNPNPDLEEIARTKGWPIYFPDSVRRP